MESINIAGAIAGGVLAFVLGGIWYSPAVFGHAWIRAAGLTEEGVRSASKGRMVATTLPASLIAAFVFAAFLGDAGFGLATGAGFAAGLFWVTTSFAINYTFEQRPLALLLVNGGYHTLQFTLYGLAVGAANHWLL